MGHVKRRDSLRESAGMSGVLAPSILSRERLHEIPNSHLCDDIVTLGAHMYQTSQLFHPTSWQPLSRELGSPRSP